MTREPDTLTPADEIEALLPWYATGRLAPAERARVEAALAADPHLRASLALVEEDFAETVTLNESLGAPSARARENLFARISAEGRRPAVTAGLLDRVAGWFQSLAPRTLAWSAAAAGLLIVLQAGMLAGTFIAAENTFQTASGPGASASGSYALVAFAPEATADQIVRALQASRAVIVDGPRPGGLFRVRLAEQALPAAEYERTLAALRAQRGPIRMVAPTN